MCAVSVWWYILFTLLTIFLTAAVAINLQVVFLLGYKNHLSYRARECSFA
jgi:hypothetical protein